MRRRRAAALILMPNPAVSQEDLTRLTFAIRDARLAIAQAQREARKIRLALERGEKPEPGSHHIELRDEGDGGFGGKRLYLDGVAIEF